MKKAEQKRWEKWAKEATGEDLLSDLENYVDSVAKMSAIEEFAWGPTCRAAEKEREEAQGRANILRAELLRRLGGAS